MIGKIQTNQLRELLQALSSGQPNSGNPVKDSNADVSVQVNYNSLIDMAMQTPRADDDVIATARELLLSGKLESPKKCREAAENIVKFGI
jgi:hypothetical protein